MIRSREVEYDSLPTLIDKHTPVASLTACWPRPGTCVSAFAQSVRAQAPRVPLQLQFGRGEQGDDGDGGGCDFAVTLQGEGGLQTVAGLCTHCVSGAAERHERGDGGGCAIER